MKILQPVHSESQYIDLATILKSLIENKRWILATSLIFFILSISYTILTPAKYQTTLLLQKDYKGLGSFSKDHEHNEAKTISEESIALQIALIRSRFILSPVIHDLGLEINVIPSNYTYFSNLFARKKNDIHISILQLPASYQKRKLYLTTEKNYRYKLFNDNNKILLEGKIGQFETNSNQIAIKIDKLEASVGAHFIITKKNDATVLKEILSNLTIVDLSNSSDNSNKNAILQLSLIGSNAELIPVILNRIAKVTQQKSIERKTNQIERRLTFLNQQLPLAKQSLQEAEMRLNQYRATSRDIDITLHTHYLMNRLSEIDKQLQELKVQKSNLLQQYTPKYPFVRSIENKISDLQAKHTSYYDELKKLPASNQLVALINREITVKNNLYISLLNQIHELQVIKAGIVSDIEVLLPATVAEVYMPIKITLIGVASLFIGALLGSFIVLMLKIFPRYRLNDTSPPVIEVIPH